MKHDRRNLKGQRNQCAACGEFFASNHAFEKHRIGKFGQSPEQRRCKTADEMRAEGWTYSGWWRTPGRVSADAALADAS